MLIAAVLPELINIVITNTAKLAERMPSKTGLVGSARATVRVPHMGLQLITSEQFMLMRKDLLMSDTNVTHLLAMNTLYVAVQIGPAQASEVAAGVWAVVA
mgnify:CR=1 FL=1